jgi:ribosome biogenesis protein Tsr3
MIVKFPLFHHRLEEIPFKSMGKGKNQRILPLLFAANSVNYGRYTRTNTILIYCALSYHDVIDYMVD